MDLSDCLPILLGTAEVHGFDPHDPAVIFALALIVVLVVPLLFERLRMPGIIGLIVSGIVLGPHAMNWIPDDSLVEHLGSVGLLYLMFLVGLEIDMHRFRQERRDSLIFGLLTFLIPQILGTLGAVYLLGLPWPASILMASMFASHTLVPYSIVQRLGLVKERVVTTTAGGTVLTDTLALLVLAVIAETTRGAGLTALFWLRQGCLFIVYAGAILVLAPRISRWFFRRVGNVEGMPGFLFVLAIAFGSAVLAPLAGLEPIIGSFLAGLGLNLLIPDQSRLMIRLRFVGESLFIPFFLISVGLRVDVGLLAGSGKAWLVMAYMVGAGYFTKFAAACTAGKLLGFNRDETGLLFGLSVNQAAATLAAVIVGVRLGVFSDEILNGTILMILATCLLGPYVTERYGRRLALQLEGQLLESSGAPERIMVPVRELERIESLMALALMLRRPRSEEAIYPAMVVPESDNPDADTAAAEKVLATAAVQAVEADAPVRPVIRVSAEPVDELLSAARDLRISTLVMDDGLTYAGEFEHVPTRLIERGRHLVFRFLNPVPLNTCRHIWVAVPPLLERQAGFAAAWASLLQLNAQAGSSIRLIAERSTLQAMERRQFIRAGDPDIQRIELAGWGRVTNRLRELAAAGDLIVLFLARTGQLAWQPVHARLPDAIRRHMPDRACLIVYPPEMKWEKDYELASSSPADQFQRLFPPEQVYLGLDRMDISAAVRFMVGAAYPQHDRQWDLLLKDLETMQHDGAIRIASDSVLLHSHKASPPAPMVLLAASRSVFREAVPEGGDLFPAHILLLLLGVPDESPEEHLRRLAAVSSMLHIKGVRDAVREADTYDDLIARLDAVPEHARQESDDA